MTIYKLSCPYKVPYNSVGMVALSRLRTTLSPCPSCFAASQTFWMYSSISSVFGLKEKALHISCKCLIFLPWVEKYLLKCWVNSCQLPPNGSRSKPWYHSLAKFCSVCLNLSMLSFLSKSMASIQSSVANKWASGHSPGSPLNRGGGILTQGLRLSSSSESELSLPEGVLPRCSALCVKDCLLGQCCAEQLLVVKNIDMSVWIWIIMYSAAASDCATTCTSMPWPSFRSYWFFSSLAFIMYIYC